MKTCSKCKQSKPLTDFRCQSASRDGRASYCRCCADEKHREWCQNNKETRNRHHRENWARNGVKKLARKRERYLEIVAEDGREKFRSSNKKSYVRKKERSPGHYAAKRAERKAAEIRATPPWVDRAAIAAIYAEAAKQGKHVDHIHPLRGENVCGLHVPWNLQLLDPVENKIKGNRLIT